MEDRVAGHEHRMAQVDHHIAETEKRMRTIARDQAVLSEMIELVKGLREARNA